MKRETSHKETDAWSIEYIGKISNLPKSTARRREESLHKDSERSGFRQLCPDIYFRVTPTDVNSLRLPSAIGIQLSDARAKLKRWWQSKRTLWSLSTTKVTATYHVSTRDGNDSNLHTPIINGKNARRSTNKREASRLTASSILKTLSPIRASMYKKTRHVVLWKIWLRWFRFIPVFIVFSCASTILPRPPSSSDSISLSILPLFCRFSSTSSLKQTEEYPEPMKRFGSIALSLPSGILPLFKACDSSY